MNNLIYVTLILGFFDTLACISAKFWATGKGDWIFVLSVASFTIAGIFFALSARSNPVALLNVAWVAASAVFVTLFGIYYFKENISFIQSIGLGLILFGFILINLKSA